MNGRKELKDVKPLTDEMRVAIEDGIQYVEEYTYWKLGYIAGYKKRQQEVLTQIIGMK